MVRLDSIKNGHSSSGRNFPLREYEECDNMGDFLRQYSWSGDGNGYLKTGKNVKQHKLVWSILKGEVPKGFEIDHIDGNKYNNDISNLRLLPHNKNCMNASYSHNQSGHRYIGWFKPKQKFRVRVKKKHVGYYKTLDDAIIARDAYIESLNDPFLTEVMEKHGTVSK